eukprot:1510006-Prymnesium_polylepis.2
MEYGSEPIPHRPIYSIWSYGDNRMAPDCATGRYIHVGRFVQATECLYLRDKWFPEGEFHHVVMDPAAATLRPWVAGSWSSPWWIRALGSWDFGDPDRVTAEFTFWWGGCRIVGVGIGVCNRTIL